MQLHAFKAWISRTKRTRDSNDSQPHPIEYVPVYSNQGTSATTLPSQNSPWPSPTVPSLVGSSVHDGSSGGYTNTYGMTPALSPDQQHLHSLYQHSPISENIDDDELVNLFYSNFFSAHPILVPACLYHGHPYPEYVRQVVLFIGSHYSLSVSSDALRMNIDLTGPGSIVERNPTMVQARLLFAIALHARGEAMDAACMMQSAVQLAIDLNMNLRDFAPAHGSGNPILEESLRRTWWELYCMDGYMAALHKLPSFKSNTVRSDVLLPCEEMVYASAGCLPQPSSLQQFDMRLFADEEIQFSSFAYRIEAARILARVLSVAGTQNEDQVQVVDNALAGWIHSLPQAKVDVVNVYNTVDEMLFQGHMIIHCATIYLHLPRSDLLNTLPVTANIVCAERGRHMSPASTQHSHSVKATNASKELSNLAAVRVPVQKHTPFFVCGLVLGAIVQLSACSANAGTEQHRDRVTLIIGLLKSLSRNWAISGQVLQQVKKVASEVLRTSTLASPNIEHRNDTNYYDSGISMRNNPDNTSWLPMLNMVENQEFHGLMHVEPIYPGTV
ncbi:unnamed protein product [Aureobasidium uvarum]|uniref:Xylanolytic transcriptional activator regulatory domain-containing protein n=1 Tax=Aureobasidium uvarum TaxID=2773716 RepID=A0A9N8KKA9_9PEZI|nr:unnamed protein product [Aureobasidium uvarum]